MKTLTQRIGTAVLSTVLAGGCAFLKPYTVENHLKNAYGCVGISKPVQGISEPSLRRIASENRARSNYITKCKGKKIGKLRGIRVVYDSHKNIFIAYKPNK